MPEADRPPAARTRAGSRLGRRIEATGVVLLLAAFGFFLWRSHELIAWSEPADWYYFGRRFGEAFGATPLAYGFPLAIRGGVALAGPIAAYPLNGAILVGLAALLYAFARSLVPREPELQARLAPVAGAVALALLVLREPALLVELISPYPDPLAWALVLLSCLLLLRYCGAPGRRLAWVAGSGASLALACSTRGTSAWMLLPFLFFGLASRRRVPLGRAAGVFAASFAVFCIPMLVHNHGVTGRFWMPAQAGLPLEAGAGASGTAGAELRGLSGSAHHLWSQLGWQTLLLALAGIAAALQRRQRAIPALVVPAFLTYAVALAASGSLRPRDLFALDLFVLPAAGVGVAAALHAALRPLGSARLGRGVAASAGAVATAAAIFVALEASREPARGFRLGDARAFTRHIEALVPQARPILGEELVAEVLRCFVADPERVAILEPRRLVEDAAERARVRAALGEAEAAYLVSLHDSLPRILRGEFDLELLAGFRASTYGLPIDSGDSRGGDARLRVERVARWSRRETSQTLAATTAGPKLLEVDVGRLSSEPRESARVYWNDRLLDNAPRDGANYYAVRVVDAGGGRVWLRSDGPVPARIEAGLRPLSAPIRMRFDVEGPGAHRSRLSESFFGSPGAGYPVLRDEGRMLLPTPDPADAVFVAVAEVAPQGGAESGNHDLLVGTPDAPFYRLRLRDPDAAAPKPRWRRISFAFHAPLVTGDETSLVWRYRGPPQAEPAPGLALRGLALYRRPLAPELTLDLGVEGDEPFLLDGFGEPERLPAPGRPALRATGPRAELRIPLAPDPRPARLELRYLTGLRPASAPPASPELRWNDVPLVGESRDEPVGRFTRVTTRVELPPELLRRVVNHLVIRSTAWQGRGILLERVALERAAPA